MQSIASRWPGFLSGFANLATVASAALLAFVASLDVPPRVSYPIENTLRAAAKRPLVLYGADGSLFARRGECVAAPVTLAELPPHFIDAVLAMEDRRFYKHFGIDPRGILRAAVRNYEAGSIREGGSTITQQLVKISYLSSATTIERKLEEAMLALWLELRLTKDEILERYLSSVYFGEGCFGVRAATRHFFGKRVAELTVPESALMVALIRSPTRLSNDLEGARADAALVMRAMVNDGRLDEAELAAPSPIHFNATRADQFGSYFADWLAESMQKDIQAPTAQQPIRVHTTFEPALQLLAEDAVRKVLDKQGRRRLAGQAGLVAMRTDGRVVAMLGGTDWASSQFNRAVQARRQPGSAFKTFVYLTALQAGVRPHTVVADEPISIDGWEPQNYGERFAGAVSLNQAFNASINTVAVKLSEAVGREAVIATARDLGIASPLAPNASLPLGTSEVSLLEITAAYAAIAAGAFPVIPWGVSALDAEPGEDGAPPAEAGLWRLDGADGMRSLLASVVQSGSGRSARLSVTAYGKTGTSQEHRDAWFIGFAGNLVVGVWVGNDDDTPMKGVTGGSLPAEIWRIFMQKAIKEDKKFQRKLAPVAAFEARKRAPANRALSAVSLRELTVTARRRGPPVKQQRGRSKAQANAPATQERSQERAREPRRYAAPRNWPRQWQPAKRAERAERPRRDGRDFSRRLSDMAWPGEKP